jgi:Family of unknown function (DUF5990)
VTSDVVLEIHGHHFPGRVWHIDDEPCHNVHVGIQVGRDPADLVPGDSDEAVWRVDLKVVEGDAGLDFRGPAVQGRRGERFVYLIWGAVSAEGAFTMFRRAKLMLGDLANVVWPDRPIQRLVVRVDLTDGCGGPRCARLRPPALELPSTRS